VTARRLDGVSYVEHLRRAGVEMPELGSTIVLALHPAARPARGRELGGPFGAVERERFGGKIATVTPLGPGPAVTAITIEMLAALGVSAVIGVGIASRLARDGRACLDSEGFVIDTAASDESVANSYGGHRGADPKMTNLLCNELGYPAVKTFSTSVPFRLDVGAALACGASTVEMEAAALFSVSKEMDIAVGLTVVISDTTTPTTWQPADSSEVRNQATALGARCRAIAETNL